MARVRNQAAYLCICIFMEIFMEIFACPKRKFSGNCLSKRQAKQVLTKSLSDNEQNSEVESGEQ